MRYRYNNIYDIVRNDDSNVSLQDLEKVIKDLIPSQDNASYNFDSKFRELEKLIDENTNQLNSLNKEKDELLKLVDDRLNTVENKLEELSKRRSTGNTDLDVVMDELEKQKEFNDFICEKVDDRIDRINELIDFINEMKIQLDTLDPNNNISKNASELQEQLEHINERLNKLENGTPVVKPADDQDKIEEIIDQNNDEENEEFEAKLKELLTLLEEQKEENMKLVEELSKRNSTNDEVDDETFNENWLKEFELMQLSLEDDGIYEYDVEELGEDMKYEYYKDDLPKTKIVKVKSNESVRNYTHDEINGFIGEEARKMASREIDKLQSDSEITQKAWLANNQRISELASIIEKQEEEIRRLSAHSKVGDPKFTTEDSIIVELEKRVASLENGSTDGRLSSLEEQLEAERRENARLRAMLENSDAKKTEPVVVNVNNVQPTPTPSPVEEHKRESSIVGAQRRKRKQKFFFEIKEHTGPKITKADLDREETTKKSK